MRTDTSAIAEYLDGREGLLWGVARTEFSAYCHEFPYAIVLALRYVRDPGEKYDEEIYHCILEDTRKACDNIACEIYNMLAVAGAKALIPPPSQTDERKLEAPFSFKHAAYIAGLGFIGKCSVLVTPQYGPRVLLRAVLTDLPIREETQAVHSTCGECRACEKACPWGFIKGENWEKGFGRETLIDYHACNRKRSGFIAKLGRKHTCGYCILACPKGRQGRDPAQTPELKMIK